MPAEFPTTIPTISSSLVDGVDAGDDTSGSLNVGPHAAHHNKLASEVVAIATALGPGLNTITGDPRLVQSAGASMTGDLNFDNTHGVVVGDARLSRSAAKTLNVAGLVKATGGLATITKAGVIADADITGLGVAAAVDGTLGVNTLRGQLQYRSGGAWLTIGRKTYFSVMEYGAVGNNINDDSPGFQAAADAAAAASGILLIPEPPVNYKLTTQVTFQPATGSQFRMDIIAAGPFQSIVWAGGDNTSVFKSYGWKHSLVKGVKVRLASGTKTGVVVWDVDHDSGRGSTGQLSFHGCLVTTGGTATSCVGWRIGHTAGSESSFINWHGCSVDWNSISGSSIGYVNEDNNGLNFCWFGSSATACAKGWTNQSTAGAASSTGGPEMYWYGCGGTGNTTDIEAFRGGSYAVHGGRFELGKRFLLANAGATNVINFLISGTTLGSYSGDAVNGRVFEYNQASGTLTLQNIQLHSGTGSPLTAAAICLHGTGAFGSLVLQGGAYEIADPPYQVFSGTWKIYIDGAEIRNNSGNAIGHLKTRSSLDVVTVAEGATFILGTATGLKIGTATTQKLGFYNAAPIVQPSAYTQTYATADKTHANPTSADLTGIATSTTGSALVEPSAAYTQAEMQQNFRRIQDQHNALRADVLDVKQLVNSVIDDLQALGLVG